MEDFFLKTLSPLLTLVIVSVGLAYLARRGEYEAEYGNLRYASGVQILGWAAIAIFMVVAAVLFFLVDWEGQGLGFIGLIAVSGLFALLGIYLILEARFTKGHFDSEKICVSSFWTKPKQGLWKDLEKMTFKRAGQYFELVFTDGTKIGLSKILGGVGAVRGHVENLGIKIENIEHLDR
ncbi:MAG: hypothetical protein AAF438_01710 [Pseudomonadota bacterium]